MRFAKKSTLLSIFFSFAFCLPALAQTRSGEANGTVTDTSGAVVPGATVTLTNAATNIEDHATTNGSGIFRFVNVQPGTYNLKVEKPGFKSDQTSFQVAVNQAVTQNMTLSVGSAETTVEVTAQAPVLDSTSSSLGAVIEEKTVQNLPLNGRNFTQLLTLTPGVTPISTSQNKSIGGVEGNVGLPGSEFSDASFYGQFNRSKLYFYDGIINTNIRGPTYTVIPDPDLIREFKVTGQDSNAEIGGAMGGVVNMISTSGTNSFHGSAFEYVRNNAFDARNGFKDFDAFGNPKGPAPFHQNQFGATIGGPIIRNRTFFSFGYAGWRFSQPNQDVAYVPTAAEINGDFSQTKISGTSNQIFNPFSTSPTGKNARTPFMCDAAGNPLTPNAQGIQPTGTPCNKIPQALINPAMQAFFKTYSATPNYANPSDPTHNFIQNRASLNNSDEYSIRVDHRFRDSDNVFFRYTQQNNYTYTPIGEQGFTAGGSPGRNYGGDYVHTFSPTLILDIRGGYTGRPGVDSGQQNDHAAGLDPLNKAGFTDIAKFHGMLVNLSSPWNNGTNSNFGIRGSAVRQNPSRSFTPSITWLKGNHNIKAGFWYIDGMRGQQNTFQTFNFRNTQTSNPANSSNTGLSLASALLALPDGGSGQLPTRQGGEVEFRYATYAGYLQDEWKTTRNLTLTLGLRYDYLNQPHTTDGRLWNALDLKNQLWIVGAKTLPGFCSAVGQAPCIPDAFKTDPHFNNVVAAGKPFFAPGPVKDNWGPRIGVAYQLHPKTVLRGGVGLYWDSLTARSQYAQNDLEQATWPDALAFDSGNLNTASTTGAGNFQFLSGIQGHFPVSLPPTTPWGVGGNIDDPRIKDPYSLQYHVEVQQEITTSSVLSLGYVGSKDGRLPFAGQANAATQAQPADTCATADTACITAYKATVDRFRLMPWVNISSAYEASVGTSHYNALLARFQHRYSNGLSTLFSYTWSKSIDTTSGYFGSAEAGPGGGSNVESFWNRALDRGLSAFDVTHFFSWANVYELPAGKGKRFFQSGPLSWFLGNWETESILQARSGQPFTLQVSGDIANLQGGAPNNIGMYGRPNEIADPFVAGPVMANPDPGCHTTTAQGGKAPVAVRTPTNYFNPCAFTQPQSSFGDMGRDALRSPAVFNTDFSLTKNFPIGEAKQLQLHFQFFNIFNVQNWDTPNTSSPSSVVVNSSGMSVNAKAGLINSLATGTTPREMQFGLHFRF